MVDHVHVHVHVHDHVHVVVTVSERGHEHVVDHVRPSTVSTYSLASKLPGLDSESALLGLSVVAAKRNDLARAEALASSLPDTHYKAAEKYVQLGSIFARQGRLHEAADALERAVEINPGLLPVYPVLEVAWNRLGRLRLAQRVSRQYAYARTCME